MTNRGHQLVAENDKFIIRTFKHGSPSWFRLTFYCYFLPFSWHFRRFLLAVSLMTFVYQHYTPRWLTFIMSCHLCSKSSKNFLLKILKLFLFSVADSCLHLYLFKSLLVIRSLMFWIYILGLFLPKNNSLRECKCIILIVSAYLSCRLSITTILVQWNDFI